MFFTTDLLAGLNNVHDSVLSLLHIKHTELAIFCICLASKILNSETFLSNQHLLPFQLSQSFIPTEPELTHIIMKANSLTIVHGPPALFQLQLALYPFRMLWSAISIKDVLNCILNFLDLFVLWIYHNHLKELVKTYSRRQTSRDYDFFRCWNCLGICSCDKFLK